MAICWSYCQRASRLSGKSPRPPGKAMADREPTPGLTNLWTYTGRSFIGTTWRWWQLRGRARLILCRAAKSANRSQQNKVRIIPIAQADETGVISRVAGTYADLLILAKSLWDINHYLLAFGGFDGARIPQPSTLNHNRPRSTHQRSSYPQVSRHSSSSFLSSTSISSYFSSSSLFIMHSYVLLSLISS